MKNLRKVLAFTLALAMLLSTMTFTTFAASKEVEALANLKLLLNTTDAEVEQELTRSVGLAMVLKALGYAQADADAKAADNKFVDMDDAAWAKGYAALAEELKISNGTSVEPKLFSPMQKLDQKSFVTFMLRALGYDADKAWAEAGALAKEAGLVAGELAEGAFKKGDAAVVMYNALLAKVQGDEKGRTLAEKLVDEKKLDKDLAVANGLMSAEPENLEVVSVMADNLREVTVMFNGSVDKDTAEKVGNYKLRGKGVGEAKLMEDNKTVVLTLSNQDSLVNKKETKLTVSGVKNIAGVVMKKAEVAFTPQDVEYPTVKNVTFIGPKSFEIAFSEPISRFAKVTLRDGKSLLSTQVDQNQPSDERVVRYTTFSTLKDGTEYLVAVGNPKDNAQYAYDYANYPNVYFEGTYQYNVDKTVPEANIVKATQEYVVVEFTKPVKGLTVDHFYHSFSSYIPKELYTKAEFKNDNKLTDSTKAYDKVWVRFYVSKTDSPLVPLPAGKVQFTVLGEAKKVKIQDNWSNVFASTTFDLEVVADREAPEVVTAEVTGEKEIKVTFNEKISNIKERERYVLLDKDGKEVEKLSKMKVNPEDGDKAVVLELSDSYAGKTLTLQLKGIKDASIYENMMPEYSTSLEFTDKTWKGIESVEFRKDVNSTNADNYRAFVYVTYKEGMDDSALEVANYKFRKAGKTVNVKGTADFYEGQNNIVQIELSYDKTKNDGSTDASFVAKNGDAVDGAVELLVNNSVKDLAGNTSSKFQVEAPIITFNTLKGAPRIKSVEAVETKKIVVKFDKDLVELSHNSFSVTGVDPQKLTFNNADAKTLEIYLADDVALGTGDWSKKLHYKVTRGSKDVYGRYLENAIYDNDGNVAGSNPFDTTVDKFIADKVAPAVAAVKYNRDLPDSATTAALAWVNGETKNYSLENAPLVHAKAEITDVAGGKKNVQVVFTVVYTEQIDPQSISNTTYALSDSYKVEGIPAVATISVGGKTRNVVKITAVKKDVKDLTNDDIITALNDVTVTQQGTVKDMVDHDNDAATPRVAVNSLAGNSNALKVLYAE